LQWVNGSQLSYNNWSGGTAPSAASLGSDKCVYIDGTQRYISSSPTGLGQSEYETSRNLPYIPTLIRPFKLDKVEGLWNWTLCSQPSNFVCQVHYTAIKIDVIIRRKKLTVNLSFYIFSLKMFLYSIAEITCIPPFVRYHEGCYLVVKEKVNRDEAQKRCQANQKSVLAILNTFGENVWLQGELYGYS
jgi:hypothetical protein